MLKITYLTSEATIKELTCISDNVDSKYLFAAMGEAQEMGLKSIIGAALYDKLKWCIENNAWRGAFSDKDYNEDYEKTESATANKQYRELLGHCQYYLAYKAVSELAVKLSYKFTNLGVIKTSAENIENATYNEIMAQRDYYISRADYYALMIQNYLLENRAQFPELSENDCHRIHANLYSAASCGIFLGGARNPRRKL